MYLSSEINILKSQVLSLKFSYQSTFQHYLYRIQLKHNWLKKTEIKVRPWTKAMVRPYQQQIFYYRPAAPKGLALEHCLIIKIYREQWYVSLCTMFIDGLRNPLCSNLQRARRELCTASGKERYTNTGKTQVPSHRNLTYEKRVGTSPYSYFLNSNITATVNKRITRNSSFRSKHYGVLLPNKS